MNIHNPFPLQPQLIKARQQTPPVMSEQSGRKRVSLGRQRVAMRQDI